MSTVVYWDNGTTIRHREHAKASSQYPSQLDIILLTLAFFSKQIQLELSSLRRAMLRNGESVYLWVRFVVRFSLHKAPAKVASIVVSIGIVIQKEAVHTNIRRLAVTTMYSLGAVTLIAITPKLIMVVWAI